MIAVFERGKRGEIAGIRRGGKKSGRDGSQDWEKKTPCWDLDARKNQEETAEGSAAFRGSLLGRDHSRGKRGGLMCSWGKVDVPKKAIRGNVESRCGCQGPKG